MSEPNNAPPEVSLDTLRARFYLPASLIATAGLSVELPWSATAGNRMLVVGLAIAWCVAFFPATRVSRIAGGLILVALWIAAAAGAPGLSLTLGFTALVVALVPPSALGSLRILGMGIAAISVYAIASASGAFLLFDDLYGRELLRGITSSGVRGWLNGVVTGGRVNIAEAPSLNSVFGPWLLLWTSLAFYAHVHNATKSASKVVAIPRAIVVWIVPVTLAAFLLSPLALVAACAALGYRLTMIAPTVRPAGTWRPYWMAAALVLGASLEITRALGSRTIVPRKVAIAQIGLGANTRPQGAPTESTVPYEAFFSRLEPFLKSQGIDVVWLRSDWKPEELAGADTAVFINQTKTPTDAQFDGLYAHVRDGMRLIVVGDHTDIQGIRGPSNRLLSGVPLRLRFDSAMPFEDDREWHGALWRDGRALARTDFGDITQISVGASVMAAPITRPLVVGMRGFADAGDPTKKPGGLGDMRYTPGEPIFGIPLAAESSFGKGTVAAVGDTSGLQDASITEASRFNLRLFSRTALPPLALTWLAWLGVASLGGALVLASRSRRGLFVAMVGLAVVFSVSYWIPVQSGPETTLTGGFVYDRSLRPHYPGFFEDEKIDRLEDLAWRHRVQLLNGDIEGAVADRAACIIVNAPTLKASPKQIQLLKEFVSGGGGLIVVSGRKSRGVTQELLSAFDARILPTPLGGAGATKIADSDLQKRIGPSASASETVQTLMRDACEVQGPGRVLTTTYGKPTSRLIEVGKGRLLIVGDDTFAISKNQGQQLKVNLEAAKLFYEILALAQGRSNQGVARGGTPSSIPPPDGRAVRR